METKNNSQTKWEETYSSPGFRHKNTYPSTEIVSFALRHYGECNDRSAVRVLDLGCGWGNNMAFLNEQGFDAYGIDFSESAVRHCREHFTNIELSSFEKLPYGDEFFDCVIDRQAIQHNSKEVMQDVFKEVYRVLKPEGLFFSVMMAQADYDHYTTYLSEDKIRDLTKPFSTVEVDFIHGSVNNQASFYKLFHIKAQK